MNHYTPAKLADLLKTNESEVIETCVELGIPIIHGRIDISLYEQAVEEKNKEKSAEASN